MFVCAIAVVGEVPGDVPEPGGDTLVGDVVREKSFVVPVLVIVCRIRTMPDVVAEMAGDAEFVVVKCL